MAKQQFNIRLDEKTLELIKSSAKRVGCSQAGIIQMAVEEFDRFYFGRAKKHVRNQSPS